MNRIQFWITTGLSGLVVVLLAAHVFLVRQATTYQNTLVVAQQVINQGQASKSILQQLAVRIFQDSQKNGGDQALKDLMTRQQITFTPNPESSGNAETPSPAPIPTR